MNIITQENRKINRKGLSSVCIKVSGSIADAHPVSIYGVVNDEELLLGRYKTYQEAFEKTQLVLNSPHLSYLGKEIYM